MQIRTRFLALAATTLLLTACGKGVIEPPLPQVATSPPASVGTAPQSAPQRSDPSVPSAASVFSADAPASTAATETIRTNAPLTDAQESTAMPIAGQENSHSAPKASDKSASSP